MRPTASSITCPARRTSASSNGLPMICSPSGKPSLEKPARHRQARQARHVHRHGEDVVQIHLERVRATLRAEREGGRRRRRRQDRVDLFEGVIEVALDERAHLLRLQVIGVVIARRQHIGADQDAALHLRAEALGARLLIHVDDIAAIDA